jgi:hypothetical protein
MTVRDDSALASLRDVLAIEQDRLDRERALELARREATAAAEARAQHERAALQRREHERLAREDRQRVERETAERNALELREIEARLASERATRLAALDARLSAELRDAEHSLERARTAARGARGRWAAALIALGALGGASGVTLDARLDGSIAAARARMEAADASLRAARVRPAEPAPSNGASPASVVRIDRREGTVPAVASHAGPTGRTVRNPGHLHSTGSGSRGGQTHRDPRDPFASLSGIEHGAEPINGTDR